MADESIQEPEVLVSVPTEAEAGIVIAALDEEGIRAEAVGGYTAAFVTAVPGTVQVLVHRDDLARAQQILDELRQVDVEAAEAEAEREQPPSEPEAT